MAVKVAINGFGRIGRLVFRALVEQGLVGKEIEVVAVGDIVPADNLAYLVKYDSIQGRFKGEVSSKKSAADKAEDDVLVVNGKEIKVVSAKSPAELPWKALGELARRPSPPKDGDQWRVNFSRVQWGLNTVSNRYEKVPKLAEDNWVWSPQGVIDMHRPERWGYVQFSTAAAGSVSFSRDPSAAARDYLHTVYYAQREFRRVNKRWARTLAELENLLLPPGTWSDALSEPTLAVAGDQFQANVTLMARDGAEHWHIRQDSLIWRD